MIGKCLSRQVIQSLALPVVVVILTFGEWFDALLSASISEAASLAHQ
jgi:hypothetical protein